MAHSLQEVQSFDEHLLFYLCCTFGTVVGAIAGASASSRVRMDMFGIIACGTIASLGGGTVRDLLLSGHMRPNGQPVSVFWMSGVDVDFFYQAILTSL
ncbi:MAG: TRIC cation channel family protein, partial [Akkermansia sp.]|nr:TRIC cation channel family protein [Akkermansia sp.]